MPLLEHAVWPLRLERRARPSRLMRLAAAPLAAIAMLSIGVLVLSMLGKNPAAAFNVFFVEPFTSMYGIGELLLKATPLMLCALGLAIGYRANVWNIGAEGQFIVGALAGGGVALFFGETLASWTLPAMTIAGVLGGMAWAAIPAFLRTRFHTSEIFVSLMLVYIAQLLLSYLVHGPWRDPAGQNFPQSRALTDSEVLTPLLEGTRLNLGFFFALLLAGRVLVVRQDHRGRISHARRRAGAGGGGVRWHQRTRQHLARVDDRRRHGGTCGHFRNCGSDRRAATRDLTRVWIRRHHRRFRRSASSVRDRAGIVAAGCAVSRRRVCPSRVATSRLGERTVSGDVAVLHVGGRTVHSFSSAMGGTPRRAGPRPRVSLATWIAIAASTVAAATPLVYAALGELVAERAGVLNLGVEGMMLVGAVSGFVVGVSSGSLVLAYLAAAVAGALLAMLFAVLTLSLQTNQVATGLALTLFGIGASAFAGRGFVGLAIPRVAPLDIPLLSKLPLLGPLLFHYDLLVYGSIALCGGLAWLLQRTRVGLRLRAVGEAPAVAHALGEPVLLIRYLAVLFGGAMSGIGGAYLSTRADPHVGRRHERRTRLDRTSIGGIRYLETLACLRRGVPVWRSDSAAAVRAGLRGSCAERILIDAAVCGHHRGPGCYLSKSRDHCAQPAGVARQDFSLSVNQQTARAMFDVAPTTSAVGWRANLDLVFERRASGTVLTGNRHEGPLLVQKALYPERRDTCHVVVLHPPGGIAASDRLRVSASLQDGARALLTTPGATKWYRSDGPTASQQVELSQHGHGLLEWLPRENILFDGARISTALDVVLSATGTYFGWEILGFGRRASGETWRRGHLRMRTSIRRGGRLLWSEAASVEAGSGFLQSPVGLSGFSVCGTFLIAGYDISDNLLAACREVSDGSARSRTGITRVPDMLIARYLGDSTEDGFMWFTALWTVLRPALTERPACAPRVWAC